MGFAIAHLWGACLKVPVSKIGRVQVLGVFFLTDDRHAGVLLAEY